MTTPAVDTGTNRTWQALVATLFLAMVAMNALANILPLFGRSTGEISDNFPSLFTPAGYTFAVWGLIYLALAAFVIYQASGSRRDDAALVGLRPLFVLSCFLNIGWLVSWHALAITISEVIMIALLVTLIAVYRRSGAWREPVTTAHRWLVHAPFSLYLGWITVATVANTSIFLLDRGFDGGAAATAVTVFVIAVATGLGLAGVWRRRDGLYALVIAWGLGGVAVARASEVATISYVALACVVILAIAGLWALMSRTVRRNAAGSA